MSIAPVDTLAARVKATQLKASLLAAAAARIGRTTAPYSDLTSATPLRVALSSTACIRTSNGYSTPRPTRPQRPPRADGDPAITSPPNPSFTMLGQIDWDDTTSILRGCTPVFDALSRHPTLLARLVADVAEDSHLADMCEGYDFMHKLVLYDAAEHSVRLRLHIYQAGFFDRPHNHRWSFASHILRGGYVHRIFGRDDQFGADTDPASLLPIHERREQPGSTYALHHTQRAHHVQAEADTISLLVQQGTVSQTAVPDPRLCWWILLGLRFGARITRTALQ